jgi:hypothetical protein
MITELWQVFDHNSMITNYGALAVRVAIAVTR